MDTIFWGSAQEHHSLVIGGARKGKSVFTEQMRLKARALGHLLVDTQMFRNGKGLNAYEYDYARRIVQGSFGRLPRAIRGKPTTFIPDVSRPQRTKWKPKHLVTTSNGITLDRKLVKSACEELQSISGIALNQRQLIELMEQAGIDEMLFDIGEAETQIRESLAEALSLKLIGRSWPTCGALHNKLFDVNADFSAEINAAAKAAGYKVF